MRAALGSGGGSGGDDGGEEGEEQDEGRMAEDASLMFLTALRQARVRVSGPEYAECIVAQ